MRKLLLGALLLLSTLGFGQDRVEPVKKLSTSPFTTWLTMVNAYDYDETAEKWINRKNYCIDAEGDGSVKISEKYKKITEAKSHTKQNFSEIGIMKIKYDGVDYIGICFKRIEGRYRYPAIYEDWYTELSYNIVVYKMEEIDKLKSLDSVTTLKSFINVQDYNEVYGSVPSYKDCYKNLNFCFKQDYIGKMDKNEYTEMPFKITTSNNKKVVRFLLPEKCYPESYSLSKYDKRIDFDKHYFEISIEEFNKLLTMIK
jgi:hypothetical protein